jgi:DNA-binding winged helix-turn-helix (wHTH) protein/tetratricopeptide (TPR) repeat protein
MLENSSRKSQEILNRHGRLRFASFEVDLEERELRKAGARVRLQHKPFRILELLLRQPGSLVTRKELARDLWPNLHVSFEHSLNSAINALRQVLGDSSRKCRFIETRSGLGYRFIAPVEEIFLTAHAAHANSSVYDDCLRGKFFLNKMTGDGRQRAIGCFQAALNEDPHCGLAHAGLADVYCQLALGGTAPAADLCQPAREFALSALRAAPNLPEAHVSLGRVRMIFDWDWSGALAALNHAATLHPELPEAHSSRALLLSALGRYEEALREIRRAQTLDPLSLPIGQELAWILYVSEASHEAVEQCWKVLSLEPRFSEAQSILGLAYQQLGLHDEAITELQNACVCSDRHPSAIATLGHGYANAGFPAKAADSLVELADLSQRNYVSPYWRAIIHAGLGDRKSAVDELQTAFSQRDPLLLWLGVDPRLASVRREAGFVSLLRRLGFD